MSAEQNGRISEIHQGESESDGIGYYKKSGRNRRIKYSLKTAKYIPYGKVVSDNIRAIRKKLNDLYQGIDDAVADGIAIENGDTIYVVDSGRENGSITFGIRRKKRIIDARLRIKFIRSKNNDAVSNGYVSDELSSKIRGGVYGDSGRNL